MRVILNGFEKSHLRERYCGSKYRAENVLGQGVSRAIADEDGLPVLFNGNVPDRTALEIAILISTDSEGKSIRGMIINQTGVRQT